MEVRIRCWLLILAIVFCLCAGCGSEGSTGTAGRPAAAGDSIDGTSTGKSSKGPAADTADGAVLAVVEGLKQNRVEVFWDFLPESFQNDLNKLVHTFAERMDPELWSKSVGVLRNMARMLQEKKEFLAAARASKDSEAAGPPAGELAAIGELLDTVLDGDLTDLEKMKTADGRKILAGPGSKLLAKLRSTSMLVAQLQPMGYDPFADRLRVLTSLKVTLVSSAGDSAKLTLEDPDGNLTERDFVRVEGKWIPKDIADNWHENMGEAAARLSLLSPDNLAAMKPQLMGLLSAVDEVLRQMSAARTQKQFMSAMADAEQKLQPFQQLVLGLMGTVPEDEPEAADSSADEPVEMVTVVVKGSLAEDAQDRLRDLLHAVTDDRSRAAGEITGDDETTTIRVGPVGDVEAFARRLDFLKVTRVDPKNRMIMAEVRK